MTHSSTWTSSYGHRIVKLSTEPSSSSLYFNYNAYTPEGDVLLITTPKGISAVQLDGVRSAVTPLVDISGPFRLLFAGHSTRTGYYETSDVRAEGKGLKRIFAVDIDTGNTRLIAEVEDVDIQSINCDETLLAGVRVNSTPETAGILEVFRNRDSRFDQVDYRASWPDGTPMSYADAKEVRMNERLEAGIPMSIVTIDIRTGKEETVMNSTDWLNHLLFSPKDPGLLMYCHEGPWHKVDRLWYLHLNSKTPPTKIHHRTMNMEIAGHEWWSHDGKVIWYDLQTPRGQDFWIAGYEIATGKRTWYHVPSRNEWSVHFHSHPNPSSSLTFVGDGGDEEMVAHAPDGKYLYLYTAKSTPDVAGIKAENSDQLVRSGYLEMEKLLDMSKHDYRLEPNINFTPDGKWAVFRSNMEGEIGVYMVEIAKS